MRPDVLMGVEKAISNIIIGCCKAEKTQAVIVDIYVTKAAQRFLPSGPVFHIVLIYFLMYNKVQSLTPSKNAFIFHPNLICNFLLKKIYLISNHLSGNRHLKKSIYIFYYFFFYFYTPLICFNDHTHT